DRSLRSLWLSSVCGGEYPQLPPLPRGSQSGPFCLVPQAGSLVQRPLPGEVDSNESSPLIWVAHRPTSLLSIVFHVPRARPKLPRCRSAFQCSISIRSGRAVGRWPDSMRAVRCALDRNPRALIRDRLRMAAECSPRSPTRTCCWDAFAPIASSAEPLSLTPNGVRPSLENGYPAIIRNSRSSSSPPESYES